MLVQQVVPEFCYPKLAQILGVCVSGAWVKVASTLKSVLKCSQLMSPCKRKRVGLLCNPPIVRIPDREKLVRNQEVKSKVCDQIYFMAVVPFNDMCMWLDCDRGQGVCRRGQDVCGETLFATYSAQIGYGQNYWVVVVVVVWWGGGGPADIQLPQKVILSCTYEDIFLYPSLLSGHAIPRQKPEHVPAFVTVTPLTLHKEAEFIRARQLEGDLVQCRLQAVLMALIIKHTG